MSEWQRVALSDVLVESRPGFACGEDVPDGVFQFRMNNITADGQLDFSKRRRVPRGLRNIEPFVLEQGDVLFNATNSPQLVGKSAYFPGLTEQAVFSNHFLRLRPRPEHIDGRYLSRWLNLKFQQGVFEGMCRQWVNQATVGRDALLSMRLSLPPIREQRRIADILDKADALRAKRRTASAQLGTLTQSTFLDMFGDTARRGWKTATVAGMASATADSMRTGPFGSQLLHTEFTAAGVAVLGIDNAVNNSFRWSERRYISEDKYRQLRRYTVRPGDVLITIMGTCGRCAVVPDDIPTAINTKHLCCITLDRTKCLPEYLHAYFLQHSIARRYLDQTAKGAIMSGLNMSIIKAMPIPLAPIALQQEFKGRLDRINLLRRRYEESVEALDTLFASLQHHAFHGDL